MTGRNGSTVPRPWVRLVVGGLVLLSAAVVAGVAVRVAFPPRPANVPGPTPTSAEVQLAAGKELYANSCAGCHGENGDGNGPAARFLYPKPRDFGEAKFRLVTSPNRIPSDEDLLRAITRGMPGSAMFPFTHLAEEDRRALVAYVRHLSRTGIEQRVRRQAEADGDAVDPEELAQAVDLRTMPGPVLEVPADLPAPDAGSIARGGQAYGRVCIACHGATGKGDGVQDQRDDNGMPTRPRDFTRGIFKGGRDPQQLYARIMIGMPGTPMPSSTFTPAETGDLVNFVLSLSDPASQANVEHRRTPLVARRAGGSFPEEVPDDAWSAAEPVHLVVSPLWWRNYAEPDLHVQALHDGQSLAVRLTWKDETHNAHAVRPQDFEDMAAVQLFRGEREPFLGMGAADRSVDVWLWHAGEPADVDTVYPNMAVDQYPFERPGAGPGHPTAGQPPEFLTGRAAGNLRSDPDAPSGSLQATGFGSLTMRPRVSQRVKVQGKWQDGRWTVVLRRPLQVDAEAGVPLSPGDRLSVAFALWDGAAGDRNGQKLVSIWHDLKVE